MTTHELADIKIDQRVYAVYGAYVMEAEIKIVAGKEEG